MKAFKWVGSIIIGIILVLIVSVLPLKSNEKIKPIAVNGLLDSSSWGYEEQGLLSLRGEWELYWKELLTPEDFLQDDTKTSPIMAQLPTELSKIKLKDAYLPEDGYATVRLRIQQESIPFMVYGFKGKYFASASKVWINGNFLGSTGKVATTKESYQPQYLPLELMFMNDQPEIEIIIQFTNYHHRRVRLNESFIGPATQIQAYTQKGLIKDSVHFGCLLLVALYHLIMYFLQKKREKVFIYFSVISFVVALRSAILNERILIRLIPELPGELMMKIGYLPVFVLLPLLILYVRELMETKVLDRVLLPSKYALLGLTLVIIFSPVKFYDRLFYYGIPIILLCASYVIYMIVSRGLFKVKNGAYVIALGGFVMVLAALNDYFRETGGYDTPEMLTSGVLVFVLLQAIFLAWRFNEAYNKAKKLVIDNERMYDEIQKLNASLEYKIEERTKELAIANSMLEELSKFDSLTGVANRRYLDEKLIHEWNRSMREQESLSAIMVDIDCFKDYNDYFGHLKGDECLCLISKELERNLKRGTDFLARYGGEEFLILLPSTDENGVRLVIEKLRTSIENLSIPHPTSKTSNYVTISLGGGTVIPSKEASMNSFLYEVDQALYIAKEKGRNQSYIHEMAVG